MTRKVIADMATLPYRNFVMMKMTMFIDEALLARVMKLTGLKTKTETVEFALRETERRSKLSKFLSTRNMAAAEWKGSVDPAYDLVRLRVAEKPSRYRTRRGAG
jgi:Arc/MetJ family transcription regulator